MHIHLVHKSGLSDFRKQQLVRCIESAGHMVDVLSPRDDRFGRGCDMIAVAGGDGTVEKVLRRFYGSDRGSSTGAGIPLAIIPVGTANNIARSLGIEGFPDRLIKSWPESWNSQAPAKKKLSVGKISGAGYERFFVESVGCGLLTHLIGTSIQPQSTRLLRLRSRRNHLRRRLKALLSMLQASEASGYRLLIDGRDFSGRYLLVEMMNIARVGPGLELAPGKDPGSGWLDVVLVGSDEKDRLLNYLLSVLLGHKSEIPFLRVLGRKVELQCHPAEIHVDDKSLSSDGENVFLVEAGLYQIALVK